MSETYASEPPLTLTVFSGLPGSGKSTGARRLADRSGAKVIGRDEVNRHFDVIDEAELTLLLVQLAAASLRDGISVIIDSQNLHPADFVRWRELAKLSGAQLFWHHLATPLDECVRRDSARPQPNGEAAVQLTAAQNAQQLRRLAHMKGGVHHG